MKKVLFISAMVLFPSLASLATDLFPAEHTWCLNASLHNVTPRCDEGKKFYIDQDNRCGCLAKDEFHDPDFCARAFIRCDIEAGQTYSQLSKYVRSGNTKKKKYAGCGCFYTDQNMHATSVR